MAMSNHLSEVCRCKTELVVNLLRDCILHDSLPKPLSDRVKNVMACWDSAKSLKELSDKLPDCENYTPLSKFF